MMRTADDTMVACSFVSKACKQFTFGNKDWKPLTAMLNYNYNYPFVFLDLGDKKVLFGGRTNSNKKSNKLLLFVFLTAPNFESRRGQERILFHDNIPMDHPTQQPS